MQKYWDIAWKSFGDYYRYLVSEIANPSWTNYFYWLIGLSLLVWGLEIIIPWRKKQAILRRDFWLDGFYMFFNFFLFSLVAYNAISNVAVELFNDFLALFGIQNLVAIKIASWPVWSQWLILFLVVDFISWNVHRMLHRVPWMWSFHKLHHSVKEMGFAAHLRYHWMENIFYKTAVYIPVSMIGFGIEEFFVVHMFSLLIGHLNHANIDLDYGLLKYVFNNPRMHIWHHAKNLPDEKKYGVNFGISLSIWDYLFKTNYIPRIRKGNRTGFLS